eukprot:3913511-Pleurochrysis_carterae.AAC.2
MQQRQRAVNVVEIWQERGEHMRPPSDSGRRACYGCASTTSLCGTTTMRWSGCPVAASCRNGWCRSSAHGSAAIIAALSTLDCDEGPAVRGGRAA